MTWFWLALAAAILWGLGYTLNQATLQYFSASELMLFESVIVILILLAYFIFTGKLAIFAHKLSQAKPLSLIMASSLIYLIASVLILNSISASNASLAAIIESCYPLFTVLFAYLIFGEIYINFISLVGFLLIISGIILVKIVAK